MRVVKWRDFETTAAIAWVGRNQQLAAIVAEAGDTQKLDGTPMPLAVEPTRRDGMTVNFDQKIVVVGEYRF